MSYYTLKNVCDTYCESGTGLTSNTKFTNPFVPNTNKILLYSDNNFDKNSFIYNSDNAYPCTKSYNYVQQAYQHYITQLLKKNDSV